MNIDTRQFDQLIQQLQQLPEQTVANAGAYFKSVTPVKSGNARSKTKTTGTQIVADYAYAGRLDEGYSRQAPAGMSEPTISYIQAEINRAVGRL